MWPWEHAVAGYLLYSLISRRVFGRPPGAAETVVVVIASVLPDLIDKPLAWQFGVFESGYAIGHSIFFAFPVVLAVGIVSHRAGRTDCGLAFAIGYLAHLPADVLDAYFRSGVFHYELMLWPFTSPIKAPSDQTFLGEVMHHLTRYHAELTASDPSLYLVAMIGIGVGTIVLWILDGMPVLREIIVWVRKAGPGRS